MLFVIGMVADAPGSRQPYTVESVIETKQGESYGVHKIAKKIRAKKVPVKRKND